MSKVEEYHRMLRGLDSWDAFLLKESRLPGPRANLELAFAVALAGTQEQILRYALLNPIEAPQNTKEEFLAFCGVLGLGYLAARQEGDYFSILRERASDPRWRIREAVALGLQEYGRASLENLIDMMEEWSRGNLLERRAVIATLCEPDLLIDEDHASRILNIIDAITTSILSVTERRSEDFKVLRKGLAYGWSVVVAAQPSIGKPKMEKWIKKQDPDVRWVMKQNLKKKRLIRMDELWVLDLLGVLEE
jgi:hypothetical protein